MIFARRIKNFGDFSDICHNSPMLFQARSRGGSSPGLGVVLGQVAMLFWPRSRGCFGPGLNVVLAQVPILFWANDRKILPQTTRTPRTCSQKTFGTFGCESGTIRV